MTGFPDLDKLAQWDFGVQQSAVIPITPAFASELLQKNFSDNRNVSSAVSSRYAKDMEIGRWVVGDPLSFSVSGRLVNGQHRLEAVVKAGVPVKFLVVLGLPEESYKSFDQGKKRNAHDLINIGGGVNGYKLTAKHVSVFKAMVYSLLGASNFGRFSLVASNSFLEDLIPYVLDGIEFSLQSGSLNSCILSVVARAYYSQPKEKLARFLDLVQDPYQSCSLEETYATKLPMQIKDKLSSGSGGLETRALISAYTQTALSKFLQGIGYSNKGVGSRSFQPTKTLLYECPMDVKIAEKHGRTLSELKRGSASVGSRKKVVRQDIDGKTTYATAEQMTHQLLQMTVKEVSAVVVEELKEMGDFALVRHELKSIVERIFPDVAGIYCGTTAVQPGTASIASNIMQQVLRGEWEDVYPGLSVIREKNKPLVLMPPTT